MNHRISAYVYAALALIGVPRVLENAAKSDFAWLLRTQAGLASLPPPELAVKEAECRATTHARLIHLRSKTFVSLAWVAFAALFAAIAFVHPIAGTRGLNRQQIFTIASIMCFSWGTLGRLGWTERSYKGVTVFEELDTVIFWVLYWLGTLFGVATIVNAAA